MMKAVVPVAFGSALLAGALCLPALAKTDPKKESVQPRWAHSYKAAIEEMKERGCVVLATFHAEH